MAATDNSCFCLAETAWWNWLIFDVEHPWKVLYKVSPFHPNGTKKGHQTNLVSDWLIHLKIFSSETSLPNGRWAIQAQPPEPLVFCSIFQFFSTDFLYLLLFLELTGVKSRKIQIFIIFYLLLWRQKFYGGIMLRACRWRHRL